MVTDGGEVPAGWYPDPLGLPQLRWWDGKAWTEFTSASDGEPSAGDDDGAPSHVIDVDEVGDEDAADGLESTFAVPPRESFDRVVDAETGASEAADAASETPTDAPHAGEPVEVPDVGGPAEAADGSEPTDVLDAGEPAEMPDGSEAADPPAPAEPASDLAVVPEPFVPAQSDPFAAAEANALVFTTRRARRAYERKLALESGVPDREAQPYSRLDTNPVDIQLTGATTASAAEPMPLPAVPQAADPEAPTAGTPLDGHEDLLAQSTLAPAGGTTATDEAFSFDATPVSDELPPARTLIPKRTYTVTAFLLAALLPLAAAAIIVLLRVPELSATDMLAWAVCGGALLIGVLLAFLDSSALQRAGHERTASPLWALLTPVVYLPVRSVATTRETGHGRGVVLALILGLAVTALLIYLVPDLLSLIVPGLVPPWSSPLG